MVGSLSISNSLDCCSRFQWHGKDSDERFHSEFPIRLLAEKSKSLGTENWHTSVLTSSHRAHLFISKGGGAVFPV
jgi:hypothetical protein